MRFVLRDIVLLSCESRRLSLSSIKTDPAIFIISADRQTADLLLGQGVICDLPVHKTCQTVKQTLNKHLLVFMAFRIMF